MKKFITIIITLLFLVASNLFISKCFNVSFLEVSFAVGLIFSVIIAFFSSKGGFPIKLQDAASSYVFNKTSEDNNYNVKFHISIPFIVSILYTIVFAILNVATYWEYFKNI